MGEVVLVTQLEWHGKDSGGEDVGEATRLWPGSTSNDSGEVCNGGAASTLTSMVTKTNAALRDSGFGFGSRKAGQQGAWVTTTAH